jgi:hypothetical protein
VRLPPNILPEQGQVIYLPIKKECVLLDKKWEQLHLYQQQLRSLQTNLRQHPLYQIHLQECHHQPRAAGKEEGTVRI